MGSSSDDIFIKNEDKELITKLKNVGIYEIGLTNQEMRELIKTIEKSKESANKDDEYRKSLLSAEENCTALNTLLSVNQNSSQESDDIFPREMILLKGNAQENKLIDSQIKSADSDSDKTVSDVAENLINSKSNFVESSEERGIDVFIKKEKRAALRNIVNNSFEFAPFYCRPEIQNMSLEYRKNAINKYHEKIIEQYREMQNKSVIIVPWGEPLKIILKTEESNNEFDNICKETFKSLEKDFIVDSPTYSLRSRAVKRRLYKDNSLDDTEDLLNKKSRPQKGKNANVFNNENSQGDEIPSNNDNECNTNLSDLHYTDNKLIENTKQNGFSSDEETPTCTKVNVSVDIHNVSTPIKKIQKPPICSFQERVLRSKRKLESHNKLDHNKTEDVIETIYSFDSIYPPETKVQKTTIQQQNLEIKITEEAEIISDEDVGISENSPSVMRRRIIPPNPSVMKMSQRTQKIINNLSNKSKSKTLLSAHETDQKAPERNVGTDIFDDEVSKVFGVNFYKSRTSKNTNPTGGNVVEGCLQCPICNKEFPSNVIEKHASNCFEENLSPSDENSNKVSSLCKFCDEFVIGSIEKHLETCQYKN